MAEHKWLAEQFEENRGHLRSMAYGMLGSLGEADDAVQEAWLRLTRSNTSTIENLGGWLTTVVTRVCLDMLRSRKSRREESLDAHLTEPAPKSEPGIDPEQEALLADSVGLALLVVLDRLAPAERLAFVLHDMFAVPFEEIAPIVGRSLSAARQLASRARRRVRGAGGARDVDLASQRKIVEAFLAAVRDRDLDSLLAVLDPDAVIRVDQAAAPPGAPTEIGGARVWAKQALAFSESARLARLALVNGEVGLVFAPCGQLLTVLRFAIRGGKIVQFQVIENPARLRKLDLAVLDD